LFNQIQECEAEENVAKREH